MHGLDVTNGGDSGSMYIRKCISGASSAFGTRHDSYSESMAHEYAGADGLFS